MKHFGRRRPRLHVAATSIEREFNDERDRGPVRELDVKREGRAMCPRSNGIFIGFNDRFNDGREASSAISGDGLAQRLPLALRIVHNGATE